LQLLGGALGAGAVLLLHADSAGSSVPARQPVAGEQR
jgi:hypothetical protein